MSGGIGFDVENQLSVAQAFTGAATVSTHSYKKQTAAQDLSIGRRMSLLVMSADGVSPGAGSTHTLEAIQADDAALTSNVQVIGSATGVLAADLALGKQVEVPIRQGSMSKQYIGFRHTATGGVTTATLDVYFMPQDEIAEYKSFPKINDAIV
jgi:hypothetical protein